jgi:hypothetical protein
MEKRARHRPHRVYPDAQRILLDCELETCSVCGSRLQRRRPWHAWKTIQTLAGPVFLAGKSKECSNPGCGKHYYATHWGLWSLPSSTYGLDVLAFIGWQHDHEHRQLVEIQRELNQRGVEVNERHTGRLYRQFLALLSASREPIEEEIARIAAEYGGLIWAVDALQPEGNGRLLYVLYEVQSGKPLAAFQGERVDEADLVAWLRPYQELSFRVLATLSDGESTIIAALKSSWPQAPHQRCQLHFLNNLADAVLAQDERLRQSLRQEIGGLASVPEQEPDPTTPPL